jgi:hypothetical protein
MNKYGAKTELPTFSKFGIASAFNLSYGGVRSTLTSRSFAMNVDFVETAGPVVAAGALSITASRHAAIPLLQPGHVLLDRSQVLREYLGIRLQGAVAFELLDPAIRRSHQCDIRQQIGLVARSSRVMPPKIHSPRRLCP